MFIFDGKNVGKYNRLFCLQYKFHLHVNIMGSKIHKKENGRSIFIKVPLEILDSK